MKLFCIASIASFLAIILGLYTTSIALFLALCFACGIIALLFKIPKIYLFAFLLTFILFYGYTTFLENSYQTIYQNYAEKEVKLTAIIISNSQSKEYKDSYTLKVTQIEDIETGEIANHTFRILWNNKKSKNSTQQFKYGDKIEMIATYEVPSTSRNEGGFDYRQYLKTKQIAGIVTTKEDDVTKIAENQAGLIPTAIYKFKNNLIEKVKKALPQQTQGVCIGLLLGDKADISEEVQESFRQSSLSHMLAISGAHVSYILLGITAFLNSLKLHKRWSKIGIILFLIFFMALVGFTPSVTRSCIMCILVLLAEVTFCKSNVFQNLAISSMIILIINPYSLLDIGFQLSFGGTIGIMLFMNKKVKYKGKCEGERKNEKNTKKEELEPEAKESVRKDKIQNLQVNNRNDIIQNLQANNRNKILQKLQTILEKIKNWMVPILKVSICANLIILPIMLYHFNTISATFLISNLLATPVLGICLILGLIFIIFLIICHPIAILISYILSPLLQLLIQITNLASHLPFSQILLPTPSIGQIAIYYLLLTLFYYKITVRNKAIRHQNENAKGIVTIKDKFQNFISKHIKIIAICMILAILFPYFFRNFPSNHLAIYFIDVRSR